MILKDSDSIIYLSLLYQYPILYSLTQCILTLSLAHTRTNHGIRCFDNDTVFSIFLEFAIIETSESMVFFLSDLLSFVNLDRLALVFVPYYFIHLHYKLPNTVYPQTLMLEWFLRSLKGGWKNNLIPDVTALPFFDWNRLSPTRLFHFPDSAWSSQRSKVDSHICWPIALPVAWWQ